MAIERSGVAGASGVGGVYGLALPALDLADWTVPADGWPVVEVVRTIVGDEPRPRRGLHRHRGVFPLTGGGRVVLRREPLGMDFRTSAPLSDDEVVHPHLSIASAGLSYWLGRDPFHAGALVGRDGAWLVAGRSGAGKSTMLGALALAGVPVLSDDLVVMDGAVVLAGPRAIDLRPTAAAVLDPDRRGSTARRGERRRIPLGPVPRAVPVVGWIDLEWGPDVALRPLDAAERMRRLAQRRTFPGKIPTGPALLDLVERPGWSLTRPRDLARLDAAVAAVVALAGPPTGAVA